MTRIVCVSLLLLSLVSVASSQQETDLTQRVWVRPLSEHTWLIRSISKLGEFGDVESNGLLIVGPKTSILVDTPTTNEQTALVLDWAKQRLNRPVRQLIVTHWHADRMGGIDTAVAQGIMTFGLEKTIKLAREHGLTPPVYKLAGKERLHLSGMRIETFYPGHGHTVDNLVVWIPRDQVFYGACFVKASSATTLGNMAEINPVQWAIGMEQTRKRYAKAKVVIPGHGAPGGQELLEHTAKLLATAAR